MLERVRQFLLGFLLVCAYTTPEGPYDKVGYVTVGILAMFYAFIAPIGAPND